MEQKKHTPFARHTTLRACMAEKNIHLSREEIMSVGKEVADAFQSIFNHRPPKIEVSEGGKVYRVAFFPISFKKVIFNVLNQVKK